MVGRESKQCTHVIKFKTRFIMKLPHQLAPHYISEFTKAGISGSLITFLIIIIMELLKGYNSYIVLLLIVIVILAGTQIIILRDMNFINKERREKRPSMKEVTIFQVEADASNLALDITFLTLSSYRIGVIVFNFGKSVINDTSISDYDKAMFYFTFVAVLYSMMKVFDKLKLYHGVYRKNPLQLAPVELIPPGERTFISAYEVSMSIIYLMLIPGLIGALVG